MRMLLAIILGKLIAKISRGLKIGGGSAAPGHYALMVEPYLIAKLASQIPQTVLITGTNGKTTTARMLSHILSGQGLKVIRNLTGSNLERGLASTLIEKTDLFGKLDGFDLAIWELDEAAFNRLLPKLTADIVLFLNVFRDQLDRYGEVDSIVLNWCHSLEKMGPKSILLVNGDDNSLLQLKKCFRGQMASFGVKNYKIEGESIVRKIAQPVRLDFEAVVIKSLGLRKTTFSFKVQTKKDSLKLPVQLPLPGIYHIYDALAALACTYQLNLSIAQAIKQLAHYSPAFGRVERLGFGYIFLIKNPAGASQVFQTIAPQLKKADRLLIALNDNVADGTDVSWIWDAKFEQLKVGNLRLKVIVSGNRAYDLAIRLKYAGFSTKQLTVEKNLKKAFKDSVGGLGGRLFILPTYTAMLELQSILAKSGIKRHYWEQER